MANPEHVEIVKRGVKAIREWRRQHPDVQLNLSGVDLYAARLHGADLSRSDIRAANLSRAQLGPGFMSPGIVRRANMSGADLSGVNFNGADLSRANLSLANLRGANLTAADLSGVDLSESDLSGATAGFTTFGNIDLSVAKNLEAVNHQGPSTVGVDTLYRSRGRIPDVFLRGCGVPDELIAHLPSLLGSRQATQFYSCFISFSHKDEEFAERLYSRLRDEGLRVWYAPEEMKGGQKIHEQINEAIRVHDKLLLVVSDHSMTSEWVKTEIRRVRRREVREDRRILFPIRLLPFEKIRDWEAFDADTGKDMGVEVREFFIPDFSNWKDHDAFEAAFKRLLIDLKAEAARDEGSNGADQE